MRGNFGPFTTWPAIHYSAYPFPSTVGPAKHFIRVCEGNNLYQAGYLQDNTCRIVKPIEKGIIFLHMLCIVDWGQVVRKNRLETIRLQSLNSSNMTIVQCLQV